MCLGRWIYIKKDKLILKTLIKNFPYKKHADLQNKIYKKFCKESINYLRIIKKVFNYLRKYKKWQKYLILELKSYIIFNF